MFTWALVYLNGQTGNVGIMAVTFAMLLDFILAMALISAFRLRLKEQTRARIIREAVLKPRPFSVERTIKKGKRDGN